MSGTSTGLQSRAMRLLGQAPSMAVQLPISFVVFLFFAVGDLFALTSIKFNEGKYLAYRDTFREAAASITGQEAWLKATEQAETAAEKPELLAFIVLGLIALPALISSLRRRDWFAIIFGMAVIHMIALSIVNGSFQLGLERNIDHLFGLALPISFAWLVFRARIWSRAQAALLVLTYPFALAISPADGGVLWTQVLPFFSLHLSFVFLLLLLRTLYLIGVENFYVVRQFGWAEFGRVAWRTLVKWAPILVFALPFVTLSCAVERQTKLASYEERLMYAQLPPTEPQAEAWPSPFGPPLTACPNPKRARKPTPDPPDGLVIRMGPDLRPQFRGRYPDGGRRPFRREDHGVVRRDRRLPQANQSGRRRENSRTSSGESYDRVFTPGLGMKKPDHDGFWQFATEPAAESAQDAMEEGLQPQAPRDARATWCVRPTSTSATSPRRRAMPTRCCKSSRTRASAL